MSGKDSEAVSLRYPLLRHYAVAVAAVLCTVGIRWVLDPLLAGQAPLLLFTLSVMVAARYGGTGPGLFATGLGAIAGWFLFIPPHGGFVRNAPRDLAYLALFVTVGGGISVLSGQLRRARDLSRQAGQRYHTLSEAVPQLVWTCNPEGECDYLNARWTEYTGIPASQQLGFRWLEQVHNEDRPVLMEAWRASLASGADFRIDFRIRRHDGVYRWFDTRAVPLRDPSGRVLKWFGSNTDIHEAHETREALRLEQERLTRIAATAPEVICSFRLRQDGSSCFPYASPGIRNIYGFEPRDLVENSGPAFARIHPDDVGHVRETIAESARTLAPWRAQYRVLHPGRGELWVEVHSQPTRLAEGSVEWYGFIADITERYRMEQALRDRTARLEELTRTLDLAHAMVLTLDGVITYWSHGAAAMYGWCSEEATGRRSRELLKTEFPSPFEEVRDQLLATGRWEGELRQYRRDGTAVFVASHWAVHCDEQGVPCSLIEVSNDISEQKRVEKELRGSEQRLELAQAAAGIGAWDWDVRANKTVYSDGYGPLYGLPRGHHGPSSEEWIKLIHPEDRERVRRELQRALDGSAGYDTEFRVVAPDGGVRWLMGKGKVYRDETGHAVRMLGVNIDITERKTAAEQLRALSASLISAQEEERRRISRELHDDLTQRLCLIAIDLGRLTSQPSPSLPSLLEELRCQQERAVHAAELTRHIAHELHPSILDDLGIETALRSECEEFARREEIAVDFTGGNLPPVIKRETASCLYAVAREALLNVSKHAHAKRVLVSVSGVPGCIRLVVSDDGVGFTSGTVGEAFGLGIVSMRERVRWAKGSFSVESQPGHGARIVVDVPA